jgi:hypothetical protein
MILLDDFLSGQRSGGGYPQPRYGRFPAFIFVHDLFATPRPCPDETCHPKVNPTPLRPYLPHLTVTSPSNFYIYP